MADAPAPSRWTGKVALVTGASAGIGLNLVHTLSSVLGMKVAGCARRGDVLEEVRRKVADAGGDFLPVVCDLRDAASIEAMFKTVEEAWGGVDVLINNAGMAKEGGVLMGDLAGWQQMIDVNVFAVLLSTQQAVKSMRERKVEGAVINISSMSGHRVVGGRSGFYAATKHALRALTEALRLELREQEEADPSLPLVRTTQISPGLVETEFAARFLNAERGAELYEKAGDAKLASQDVVDAVVYALQAPMRASVHDVLLRPAHQTKF